MSETQTQEQPQAEEHVGLDKWEPEIAVDFDGTLAMYNGFKGHGLEVLGEPVQTMRDRVLVWTLQHKKVVIFTARASDDEEGRYAVEQIKLWLKKYGLPDDLEITNIKKRTFHEIYDDRAFHVIPNEGKIIGIID